MPLVIAATGSGKTHFIRTHPELAIADGDDIVTYPKMHRWWTDAFVNSLVQECTTECMAEYLTEHPSVLVMWFGDMDRLLRKWPGHLKHKCAAVVPPVADIYRNSAARITEQRKWGYTPETASQPSSVAELLRHRAYTTSVAARHGLIVFSSFEDAAEFLLAPITQG
jgi:hypothetical protein